MSEIFLYENLIASTQQPLASSGVTLALGQSLARGALLGKIGKALGAAAAGAGNTGGGSIGSAALLDGAEIGTYEIKCIAAGPPAVFSVVNPKGHRLADATAGVAYAGEIGFTITAAGAAFVANDKFTVAVAAGSGHVKQASLTAVDGSQVPFGVLAVTVDATLAATVTAAFVKGEFRENSLGYAAGEGAADWRDACAAVDIFLRSSVAAPVPGTY